ncbi:tetraacyldisaccharide 4'-kinase, partial [Rickettsiales bacterium]|nr:tetraacyldisaccharide 4'-kinase [Rickettsiales bacterium]
MKAPKFWQKKSLISYFLLPISALYQILYFLKATYQIIFYRNSRQNVKNICISNLTIGGAGKTPTALAIGKLLQKENLKFAYLSKGYGGTIKKLTKINKDHQATDVGDEPLLLKECSDSFICNKITSHILQDQQLSKNDFLIIDDGFQNFSWKKDFSILVIDGYYGFGNEFTFPSGPLRESIKLGIKRANLIIIVGEDKNNIEQRFCQNKKVIKGNIEIINGDDFKDKNILAFAGIARPKKFFKSLKDSGANIRNRFSFDDHYQYTKSDLQQLIKFAKERDLELVTTKKDWVRMSKIYQKKIKFLDIKMQLDTINISDIDQDIKLP